ncbi:uncharacterized protein LOC130783019 isoform X2 [Actinidia eriantha]|uniref:uncharacterized protein LOC130783019 isoform X2 n=1 Tax=Actinidia eriantha TaxID=165200 RepID=UPI00258ED83C|nr:uncharacterized protein LOC130783019 isoform X2 [Actinidia eriantha]
MSKVNSGEVHIDLESQSHGIAKDGNACMENQWRTFFVTLYVSQAFIASAKKRLLDHDGTPPATPSTIDSSGTVGRNVERPSTSTSPQVSLYVQSEGADCWPTRQPKRGGELGFSNIIGNFEVD